MYLITQTDTYIPKHTHITQTIILFKVECLSNVCTKYKYSIPQTDTYIHIHPLNMSIQCHKQIHIHTHTLNTSIQSHKQNHIFTYTHLIQVFNPTNIYIYSHTQHNTNHNSV